MDGLIKSDLLKIKILKQYKKVNSEYTASYLSEILNSKYETVKKALEFYFEIDILDKEVKYHREKAITYYRLTKLGNNLLKSNKI